MRLHVHLRVAEVGVGEEALGGGFFFGGGYGCSL